MNDFYHNYCQTPPSEYVMLAQSSFSQSPDPQNCFAQEVLEGLSSEQKFLPSRWFYDTRGSELFQLITALPEYYPTQCEAEILHRYCDQITGLMDRPFRLVELGAGDGRKTKILLKHLLQHRLKCEFVPVDICGDAVRGLTASLSCELPGLPVHGLVAEYLDALEWLGRQGDVPTLVLFLGSNIGNFAAGGDARFLRQLKAGLKPGDRALVGFDLMKDESLLIPAYQDASGITTEFNLNLLDRMNRELGANFTRMLFRHEARLNPAHSRMESWLVSIVNQTVEIPRAGKSFLFREGEGMCVEHSIKYTAEQIKVLAQQTGFLLEHVWQDQKGWFCDVVLRCP